MIKVGNLILVLLVLFTGCGQQAPEEYEKSRFGLYETREDLALELIDYSATGITLLVHNRTEDEKTIGQDYWLEKQINGDADKILDQMKGFCHVFIGATTSRHRTLHQV